MRQDVGKHIAIMPVRKGGGWQNVVPKQYSVCFDLKEYHIFYIMMFNGEGWKLIRHFSSGLCSTQPLGM